MILTRRKTIITTASALLAAQKPLLGAPAICGLSNRLPPAANQIFPSNPSCFTIPNGLVGYWGFDPDCLDFTNNFALDLSGNGNTGTLVSSPTLAQGKVGTALKLNGSSSYVLIPDAASYDGVNVGVSSWVNFSAFTNAYNTIAQKGSAVAFFECYAKNTGKLAMYLGAQSGTVSYDGAGVYTLSTGIWYHVVLTYDHLTGLTGYLNGAVDFHVPANGALLSTAGHALSIGNDLFTAGRFANATIDDIRLYNRALDPWEVLTLYRAGLAGIR